MSSKRDVKDFIKAAEANGWRLEKSTGKHLKMRHVETGHVVSVPKTPSDHRSLKNKDAQMRKIVRDASSKREG